jgi:hypothetical protein
MKKRILQRGMPLFLIAALVCSGILAFFPAVTSAATSVKYNVEILDGSPGVNLWAPLKGALYNPIVYTNEGITFQMVVDKKAKAEVLVVGKTKTKASYYPVTILAKSFKAPNAKFQIPNPGADPYDFEIKTTLVKDAIGKLYVNGGDVDVSTVQAEKKATIKIGDGTTDPEGSMVITMVFNRSYIASQYGVTAVGETKTMTTWTTGLSSVLVKGSKSQWEGKKFPDDDPTGTLPKPLVGAPVDLSAGTGTLVSTECIMNNNMMQVGRVDFLRGQVWTMKITPASK